MGECRRNEQLGVSETGGDWVESIEMNFHFEWFLWW